MRSSTRYGVGVGLILAAVLAGAWTMAPGRTQGVRGAPASDGLFQEVFETIRRNSVDSLSADDLYQRAAQGMVVTLGDEYAALLLGEESRAFAEQTTGNYYGIGVRVDRRGGIVTIVSATPDSPADHAGLRTGDQILRVDGMPAVGRNVQKLRGDSGSTLQLTVRRPGGPSAFEVALQRESIHRKSVVASTLLSGGIGYVLLNPITNQSAAELRTELDRLQRSGMRGLILDLRGNPGGILEQGVEIADLFLERGQEIVAIRGRSPSVNRVYLASGNERYPDLLLAVLVNDGTASAAEIVAGALQDHDRAVVIGVPTYGKGVVQSVYPLSPAAALRLTTGRWYTPSGRTIEPPTVADTLGGVDFLGDTAISARPLFRTDAGRSVRGGGGIVPDVVVQRNRLTMEERAFLRGLGKRYGDYRAAVTSMALDALGQGQQFSEEFAVTPAQRQELLRRLRQRGVPMSDSTAQAMQGLLDRVLGIEIARYALGREAEIRRRLRTDDQVQTALSLFQGASTLPDILRQAQGAH